MNTHPSLPLPGRLSPVQFLAGTLVYLGLGLAGLALAIPPGYASPLFPASGFAVALLLWSGRRAWPAILAGSVLLNLSSGGMSAPQVAAAAGIALGAAAQALVAATLVERLAGEHWRTMESPAAIIRTLLAAGPLACLTSASMGVGTLYLAGLIPANNLVFNWWNWFVGDVLGVLVALPLSLTFLLRARSSWRMRQLTLVLPMLVALGAIAAAYVAVANWERAGNDLVVRRHGEELSKRLEQRFIAHQEALAALKRLIEVTPDMGFAQLDHFTRITLRENPDIFALSFNPYVRRADRADVEHRFARALQRPDFEIRERNAEKRLVRAGDRPDYVMVGYIAPLEGNLPAIGYDINSEPVRQDAIRRARASGLPSITATLQLVQENRKRVGALLLNPAYRSMPGTPGTAVGADLIGFAVAVVKLDQMVQIATEQYRVPGLAFRIDDVAGDKRSLVFQSDEAAAPPAAGSWKTLLAIADRNWELSVYPTGEFLPAHRPWVAWAAGIVGLMLATLLQLLLLVTTGQAAEARRRVTRQQAELDDQGAQLKDRTALINTLFDLSPDGFVAFAPDGTIRFANPAFYQMTGIAVVAGVQTIASLDEYLRECAESPDRYASLETLFAAGANAAGTAQRQRLVLSRPRKIVLQIVGVRGLAASSIDRFAYFRDVTHEAEVDRMKSEFLSHAAHELRTPMASIYGFTELLIAQEFDAEMRRDLLQTIHKQTTWLIEIINELLDITRIESRRGMDFNIESVALPPVVIDVLAAMQIDVARWPVTVDLPADLPPVRADVAKLRQMLTNILGNAVKYSPAGGAITVSAGTRTVEGKVFASLAITDRGIGMTPEQVTHVCERFYRADTSGNTPGTGLGMAIVKEIVELLGGKVDISSAPGLGTTVALLIPVAEKAA
jgi:signal transduction histidine kinase